MSKQQASGELCTTVVSPALIDNGKIGETVSIDFDSIPDFVKDNLATAVLESFLRFMQRLDSETILEAERSLLRQDGGTLLDLNKLGSVKTPTPLVCGLVDPKKSLVSDEKNGLATAKLYYEHLRKISVMTTYQYPMKQ